MTADTEISANWTEAKVVVSQDSANKNAAYTYTFYCDDINHSSDAGFVAQYYVNNSSFNIDNPIVAIYPNWMTLAGPKEFNPSTVVFDKSFALHKKLTSISYWFYLMNVKNFVGFENICMDNVDQAVNAFANLSSITNLDLSMLDTSHVKDMSNMFLACPNLETLILEGKFSTANVTNMQNMFMNCNMQNLNLSCFKFENVENMKSMFQSCKNLTTITFPELMNTSKVTSMAQLFSYCKNLNLKNELLNKFDTSNVEDMTGLFMAC